MKFSVRAVLGFFCLASVAGLMSLPSAEAQVAGQNVNMVSGTQWPTGDPFLQRQNEPSMAVSTRNPMHVLAGANDYRSVDLQMVLTGGAETGDAWLGIFKSFDGGYTWQSNLLPGCPYNIPQCTDSGALHGAYQAGADPVVRAGTNGMFYFAGLAFDRATSATTASSVSTIFVARYNDLNNNEQLDPITYIDTHIVASGNSSQFLDKPSMAVDIPRAGASTCSFTANEPGVGPNGGPLAVKQSFPAGNVYLAYTDFLEGTKDNSTPTHLMFTHSTDCGVTWSTPVQVNTGTTTSQGSAIAVNPLTGAVYVAWRQFASTGVSDAIMIAQSTNAGKTFSKPVQVSTFQPFDQGTTLTSFRTNAYPALTTDMFGFVYVAFSARGLSSSGDARIVAAGSIDGTHWTPPIMVDNPSQNAQTNPSGRGHQIMPAMTFANGRLTLLYYDLRLDHYAGFYTPSPGSLGNYTEMLEPQGELAPPNAQPSSVFTPYIDDSNLTLRRHTLDLRVLELGIFPTVTLGPSVLLSQYEYGCCVNPETEDIEQFKFNVPNLPLFDSGQEAFLGDYIDIVPSPMFVPSGSSWAYNFMPSVNPFFHATWTDNRDVVPPPPGYSWENYTAPVVAGAISVENGQPLPKCVPGEEGMRNQNIYTAQVTGGLVAGAPGNAKPFGTTTFNGQTYPFQRAFPVEAQNTTAQPLNVRFTITNQPTGGSASFLQFSTLTTLDITIPAYSSVSRSVFATSTNAEASITVTVAQITAIGGSVVTNGLSSTAVLNPDITNPNITNPNITNPNITNDEVTNPNITNPDITNPNITNKTITNPDITNTSYLNPNITNSNVPNLNITNISATNPNITNPDITNPNITNPNITNPNITNPNITNPDITNGSIQDVTYPITNNGNTTASYTVKTATGTTIPGGIVLQTIINKLYQTPVAQNCVLGVQTHWITVANIINPKIYSPTDPTLGNPDITNSTPNEASVTLAPGETAYITIRVVNPSPATISFNPLTAVVPVTIPQAVNTTTVLANPGNPNLTAPPVYPAITIATTSLPPTDFNDAGYSVQLVATGGKPGPYTWTVIGNPPPGIAVSSTGLVSGTATNPGPNTFTVQVSDSNSPADIATHTYTLSVSIPGLTVQTVMPAPDGVVGQSYVATTLTVNGGIGPYTWTATGLPPGLAISPSTGQITGMPTVANTNGSSVTITATDAATPAESVPFTTTIRVGNPIVISPTTLPPGTIGAPYAFQLNATGGIGTLVFGPPNPATGVSLDSNGALTIADPQTPTITFSITVHDQSNLGTAPGFQLVGANYTIAFAGAPSINILYVTQPPNYVEGLPNPNSPVHIHVQDNTGAAIAGANVTMSFNGTPPCATAVLSDNADTLTQTTNGTGDVFFTFMTVNRGGVGYTLAATVQSFTAISNPFTVNGFCESGNLSTARAYPTASSIKGGALIAGGQTSTGVSNAGDIYDPVSGTVIGSVTMNTGRFWHTATTLNDGTVLIVGGQVDNNALPTLAATAEIFNLEVGTFTTTTNAPLVARSGGHTATLLADGTVLIAGGVNANGVVTQEAEIYNPANQTFTAVGPMGHARYQHTATLLTNGKVLMAGGTDNSAELYDPVAQTFSPTGNLSTARLNPSGTLLANGQVLIAGGLSSINTAELYDPTVGTFTLTNGNLNTGRGAQTATLLADGTVLIAGGSNQLSSAEVYNPANGTFSNTGSLITGRWQDAAIALNDGTVLIAGGFGSSNFQASTERYYSTAPLAQMVVTTPTPLPAAQATTTQGAHYTLLLLEQGGVGPLPWTQTSGTLPPGLDLSAGGILQGTTTTPGTYSFAVNVVDSSTPQKTATSGTLTITVNSAFAITTTSLPNGTESIAYSSTITTSGGTPPISFSLTQANFPPGLTITQPATGPTSDTLAGTPTQAGVYSFSESVVDSSTPPLTATQNYTVTIQPQPPTISVIELNLNSQPVVSWTASPSGDVTGYNVYRSLTSGGPYSPVGSTVAPTQTFIDGNAPAGATYYYVVTAVAGGVESANSNEMFITVPHP